MHRLAVCFNRTFMELKFNKIYIAIALTKMFQSYLYGIEMSSEQINLCKRLSFQSYLYGIEIKVLLKTQPTERVSIVPLWN